MSSIRVMLVLEATFGGTARYLESIVPALAGRGFEVHVVCCARRDASFRGVMRRFRESGVLVTEVVMVRGLSPFTDAISLSRLIPLIRRFRPDVLHLHSSKAGALGRLAAACGVPGKLLYTPHAFAFLDASHRTRSWVYLMLEKFLARWTGVLVAVSESEAQVALSHGLATSDTTCVVPHGVDAASRAPSGARKVRCAGDRVIVGFLGRLEEQKDPLRIIELAHELVRRDVAFEMRVGGAGRLLERCIRRARELGVADRVRFLGHVVATGEFYESLDMFVTTSRYEGLPYSVLDAMSHGLPVAGFDVPGVRDLVVPEVTGLLVPPGDVPGLANAVTRLVENPELACRLGAQSAVRVAREFQMEHRIPALVELYSRCATGSGGSHEVVT